MNRRTRLLTAAGRRLPRPDPPPASYLRRVRREIPRPVARVVLGSVSRGIAITDHLLPTTPYAVPSARPASTACICSSLSRMMSPRFSTPT